MTTRACVFGALSGKADLLEIVNENLPEGADGPNIHEASSLVIVPPRPFVTFRMHTDFPLIQGRGRREYCQIWANDDPGDYMRIDRILDLSRQALEGFFPNPDFPSVLEARWIETGVDLRDDAMGTINRYIRFQLTSTLRERD